MAVPPAAQWRPGETGVRFWNGTYGEGSGVLFLLPAAAGGHQQHHAGAQQDGEGSDPRHHASGRNLQQLIGENNSSAYRFGMVFGCSRQSCLSAGHSSRIRGFFNGATIRVDILCLSICVSTSRRRYISCTCHIILLQDGHSRTARNANILNRSTICNLGFPFGSFRASANLCSRQCRLSNMSCRNSICRPVITKSHNGKDLRSHSCIIECNRKGELMLRGFGICVVFNGLPDLKIKGIVLVCGLGRSTISTTGSSGNKALSFCSSRHSISRGALLRINAVIIDEANIAINIVIAIHINIHVANIRDFTIFDSRSIFYCLCCFFGNFIAIDARAGKSYSREINLEFKWILYARTIRRQLNARSEFQLILHKGSTISRARNFCTSDAGLSQNVGVGIRSMRSLNIINVFPSRARLDFIRVSDCGSIYRNVGGFRVECRDFFVHNHGLLINGRCIRVCKLSDNAIFAAHIGSCRVRRQCWGGQGQGQHQAEGQAGNALELGFHRVLISFLRVCHPFYVGSSGASAGRWGWVSRCAGGRARRARVVRWGHGARLRRFVTASPPFPGTAPRRFSSSGHGRVTPFSRLPRFFRGRPPAGARRFPPRSITLRCGRSSTPAPLSSRTK